MLFVTNRRFRQSPSGTLEDGDIPAPRAVSFKLDDTEPSRSVAFCRRLRKNSYKEIYSRGFFRELKEDGAEQILLYIHGFSNLPEPDIFPRATTLQKMFDSVEPGLVTVVPMIWPCDNDLGVIKDYWDDQSAADASAFGFARVLGKFIEWRDRQSTAEEPCSKRINILAHSMGNRVLRGALERWAHDYGTLPSVFRNIFMIAADVVNQTLEFGESGRYIAAACRNVAVYFANDDLALRASKVANLKSKIVSRRLGHTGPEDMSKVARNVYAIDCDDFNNTVDSPAGHSYFLTDANGQPSPVFYHLLRSIRTGRVHADPSTRSMILTQGYDGNG